MILRLIAMPPCRKLTSYSGILKCGRGSGHDGEVSSRVTVGLMDTRHYNCKLACIYTHTQNRSGSGQLEWCIHYLSSINW